MDGGVVEGKSDYVCQDGMSGCKVNLGKNPCGFALLVIILYMQIMIVSNFAVVQIFYGLKLYRY